MAAVMPMPKLVVEEKEIRIPSPRIPPYGYVHIVETGQMVGTGWHPGLPDVRDYTEDHPEITQMIERLGIAKIRKAAKLTLPVQMDLRPWCSPIEDQRMLGSCTANAAVGVVEYYERRAFNKYLDGSRLFIYKTTRDLLGWVGDTGADIRTTMAAMVMFGVPPETFWPYTDRQEPGVAGDRTFDAEPSAFIYQMASRFNAVRYVCHDPFGTPVPPPTLLNNVKTYIAAYIPVIFGFWVFPSYTQGDVKGAFPYPGPGEKAFAGHAVLAVGYDDNLKITNLASKKTTIGALMIRNSWGTAWGNAGYGWLPYDYILSQFAQDFWSLLAMNWIDTKQFGLQVTP